MSKCVPGFSTREWIMLLLLLLLLEGVILNYGYHFSDDKTVISYVSFAATIASLLLAVIAIIFGFLQSFGQSDTVNALRNQFNLMLDLQKNIDKSSTEMNSGVAKISDLATDFEGIRDSIEANTNVVEKMHKSQSDMISTIQSWGSKEENKNDDIAFEALSDVYKILRGTTYEADLYAYFLYEYFTNEKLYKARGYYDLLFTKMIEPLENKKILQHDWRVWMGYNHQILSTLRIFSLIKIEGIGEINKVMLTADQKLLSELEKIANEVKENPRTKEGAEIIEREFSSD